MTHRPDPASWLAIAGVLLAIGALSFVLVWVSR